MNSQNRIDNLLTLELEEQLGQEIWNHYDRNMTYAEYIYLKKTKECKTIKSLLSPKAVQEQEKIRTTFANQYRSSGLTENDFFPTNIDIVAERLLRFIDIPQHTHQFYEFVYVVTGNCIHKIADKSFQQTSGSFAVIPPTTPHVLFPNEDCLCLTIKVRFGAFYKMELPDFIHFTYPMVFSCPDDMFIQNQILDIYEQQEQKKLYYKEIIQNIFKTLILYVLQEYGEQAQLMTSNASHDMRIAEILNYTINHYNTVTLHEVAAHFHYNDSYFSDLFHKQTGTTFSKALREFRLKKATQFLQETNLSIHEICNEVGYKDVTQFIRNFKAIYQTTPAQYRKDLLNND